MKKTISIFSAQVNGQHRKKFTRKASTMNSTWKNFNKYAKAKGFTEEIIDNKYLGSLAWRNSEGQIMELVKVETKEA